MGDQLIGQDLTPLGCHPAGAAPYRQAWGMVAHSTPTIPR